MTEKACCPTCYWTRGDNTVCEWCRGYGEGVGASTRGFRGRLLAVALVSAAAAGWGGSIQFKRSPTVAPSPTASGRPKALSYGYAVPEGYQMRPWDEFTIHVYGKIVDESYPVSVDRNGMIPLPRVGQLLIVGQTYGSLNQMLFSKLQPFLKNVQVSTLMTRPAIDPNSPEALKPPSFAQDMPNDALLVPGTKISIHIYGEIVSERYDVEVDAHGRIKLPRAGEVYVHGLRRGDLNPFLLNELKSYLRNVQVYTLVTPRPS